MSYNPGTQQYGVNDPCGFITKPDGNVKGQPVQSLTQDPVTHVEYGRPAPTA